MGRVRKKHLFQHFLPIKNPVFIYFLAKEIIPKPSVSSLFCEKICVRFLSPVFNSAKICV